ncbi:Fic family protein [Prolixibacteraceae bacterium JC049]|nr:Fic family protein [Prolixibacteraceae bacterium JC049]
MESYKSFVPVFINSNFEWKDKHINMLLEQASIKVGELNIHATLAEDRSILIHHLLLREAIASNLMEGIQSNFSSYFSQPPNANDEAYSSWLENYNYMNSVFWGVNELKRYPLSLRMIKKTHQIQFANQPFHPEWGGKLRMEMPVDPHDDSFTPPGRNELRRLINDAKRFWNNDDLELPQLVKMAISLFQFENILPFVSGNGRTARTLMILQLISLKYLKYPVLSLSVVMNRNRMEYYHRLNQVRSKNDIEQWIRFFLNCIIESTEENIQLIKSYQSLKGSIQNIITSEIGLKRHKAASQLLNTLCRKPIITVAEIAEELEISFQAANLLVREFEKLNIIQVNDSAKRNRIFYFTQLIAIFQF